MKAVHVVLALLLIIPSLVNFYTPLYNTANPYFAGLPFFYWFQILLLVLVVPPYLVFTFLSKRLDEEGEKSAGGVA
jgi:hypothetical protein